MSKMWQLLPCSAWLDILNPGEMRVVKKAKLEGMVVFV
jgi:hypothetical protein